MIGWSSFGAPTERTRNAWTDLTSASVKVIRLESSKAGIAQLRKEPGKI